MNRTIIEEQLEQLYQEFEPLKNAMDYDEGSYIRGRIDALEYILEQLGEE